MHSIFPREIPLKNGETLIIREAMKEDAAAVIEYLNDVVCETDFLTMGKGEFNKTVAEEEEIFEAHRQSQNQIIIIAELNGEIAGLANISANNKPRQKHIGELGITVQKDHWGKGIGTKMMQAMIEWAKASGVIRKINLSVQANNEAAIKLYEKCGFEKEGTLKRDLYLNGQFYDALAMGLLID